MTPETYAVLAALFGICAAGIPVIAVLADFRRTLVDTARKVDQLHRSVFPDDHRED